MKNFPLRLDPATASTLALAPARVVALLAALTAASAAQTTLVERDFTDVFEHGADAAPIDDLDGDGITDLLMWSRGPEDDALPVGPPMVRTLSGLTLETLRDFPVPVTWRGPMGATPVADRDGDGLQDIAIHSGQPDPSLGGVRIVSSATGQLIDLLQDGPGQRAFGADVLDLGDVNGDGISDLAVSDPERIGSSRSGFVYVLSGADNQTLYTVLPQPSIQWNFGRFLSPLGDLDGDGVQDFSASLALVQDGAPPSACTAVSGATGERLWSAFGGLIFGDSIAVLDDMDGDGTPEVAIVRDGFCPVLMGSSRISIRSGTTGTLVSSIVDPAGSLGCDDLSLARADDLDGDGLADLAVSMRHVLTTAGVRSRMTFLSSVTGAVLGSIEGDMDSGYGLSVAMVADLNEDGVSEVIVGGGGPLLPGGGYPGYVSIVSPVDSIPLVLFGGDIQFNNSTGTYTTIGAYGSTVASDNEVTLFARHMRPGSFGFFLNSLNPAFLSAQSPAGYIFLQGPIGRFVGPGQIQAADATGRFSLGVDLTQWPQPTGFVTVTAGQTWYLQGWHRDSFGGIPASRFTDRLEITFE